MLSFVVFKSFGQNAQVTNQASKTPVQVLLIGSSHWNNYEKPGSDVAQTNQLDILSTRYQKELAFIANKIAAFAPNKIFVERSLAYQPKLDSLYQLYRSSDWGSDKRNEIYQLGFRVAAKLNHEKVYGIDYTEASFPFDSLMIAAKEAKQFDLLGEFQQFIQEYEKSYNTLIQEQKSLMEIFQFLNDPEMRQIDLGWYTNGVTQVGVIDNLIGPFLASEWMRRNIYSYSLIQKYTEAEDDRIMVLMGASHIAVFENLIRYNPNWKIVELHEIMEN